MTILSLESHKNVRKKVYYMSNYQKGGSHNGVFKNRTVMQTIR